MDEEAAKRKHRPYHDFKVIKIWGEQLGVSGHKLDDRIEFVLTQAIKNLVSPRVHSAYMAVLFGRSMANAEWRLTGNLVLTLLLLLSSSCIGVGMMNFNNLRWPASDYFEKGIRSLF